MFLVSSTVSWEDQQAFLAVLETGSLSGAARQLGAAQPTVRRRLEALERVLGTVLFTRSAGGLVPTEQARGLGAHARAMALASEAFARAASAPPGEVAGTVRLSVSDFIGIEVLPPMIARLRERHAKLAVEVALSNTASDLLAQEADVAVRMHPPREGELMAKRVGAIPLGFFAHRGYVARRGLPATLAELESHDLIGPDRSRADHGLAAALHPALSRRGFAVRTDSHPAQLALVRAGVGIGVVQRPAGRPRRSVARGRAARRDSGRAADLDRRAPGPPAAAESERDLRPPRRGVRAGVRSPPGQTGRVAFCRHTNRLRV